MHGQQNIQKIIFLHQQQFRVLIGTSGSTKLILKTVVFWDITLRRVVELLPADQERRFLRLVIWLYVCREPHPRRQKRAYWAP